MATQTNQQQKNKSANIPPIKPKNFDINRLSLTDFKKDDKFNSKQMNAFVHYDHPKHGQSGLVFQTGKIKLTQGGPISKKVVADENLRKKIQVPNDPEQPACVELFNMLSLIDENALAKRKDIFKPMLLKTAENKLESTIDGLFTYSPIVKVPKEKDDDLDVGGDGKDAGNKDKKSYFPSSTIKFETSFPEGDITTDVYVHNGADDTNPTLEHPKSMTDVENLGLTWQSTIQMIISVNKLWAAKAKNTEGKRLWGYGLKILRVDVYPREGGVPLKKQFNSYADDSDEDVVDATTKKATTTTPAAAKAPTDEEEADDEPEVKTAAKPAAKGKAPPVVAAPADDDEEDAPDEEAKPEVKTAAKPAAKGKAAKPAPPAEDDDDAPPVEEVVVEVKAKAAKGGKPAAKAQVVAEEDAPEEEDAAPKKGAKKPAKGKPAAKVAAVVEDDEDEDAPEEVPEEDAEEAEEEDVKPAKKAAPAKKGGKAKAAS